MDCSKTIITGYFLSICIIFEEFRDDVGAFFICLYDLLNKNKLKSHISTSQKLKVKLYLSNLIVTYKVLYRINK